MRKSMCRSLLGILFLACVLCLPVGMTRAKAASSVQKVKQNVVVKIDAKTDYSKAYEVLKLVNKERRAKGLSQLTMDKSLLNLAMQRSAETWIYWSHIRPNGQDWYTVGGNTTQVSGENIAYGNLSASKVMEAWMNSSGHRRNILNASFKSMGVGCVYINGSYRWVQLFNGDKATTVKQPKNQVRTYSVSSNRQWINLQGVKSKTNLRAAYRSQIIIKNRDKDYGVPFSGSSFKWSSSNEAVVTVDQKGNYITRGAGTAKITATLKDDPSMKWTTAIEVKHLSQPKWKSASSKKKGCVSLAWNKVSGAKGYVVYRSTNAKSGYKRIAVVKGTSYTDTKATSKKTYYYKIKAYNTISKINCYSLAAVEKKVKVR